MRLLSVSLVMVLMACGSEPEQKPLGDIPIPVVNDLGTLNDGSVSDATNTADGATDGVGTDGSPGDSQAETTKPETIGPPPCGSAEGAVPGGLVELKHDDGGFSTSFTEQFAGVLVAGKDLTVERVNQSMRYDLEHPVKIHAIKVRYQWIPTDKTQPVRIAIHPDFG